MLLNLQKSKVCASILGLSVIFLAATVYGDYSDSSIFHFDVKPGGRLTIESDLGSVDVRSSDNNRVAVEIYMRVDIRNEGRAREIMDDFRVDFDQEDNEIIVYADYRRKSGWNFWEKDRNRLRVEFIVSVPRKFALDIKTGGGSITIDDVTGDIRAETSGGSLNFERITGPIRGRTSGGSIRLRKCEGMADIKTSGGSIGIKDISGDVYARTSGGSIDVDEVLGAVDASTSGGSVTARIIGQPENDCRLTTSGGSVTVYLDENVGLEVDARTSAGYVDTDFPVTVRGKLKKSVLQGKINRGGPELYLRTSGGNIYLKAI
jgi:DUF4097 and DUF4098 domain-containing protein YvlB